MAAALLAACLLGGPARAAEMIPGAPIRAKDFALVKKDGYYHVFYIRNNGSVSANNTEHDFGHAISADLYHWTQLPPVLPVDSLGWDNTHVWAPTIVEQDGLYWMLYTGVTTVPGEYNGTQRIGLAVSSDLMTWNRVESATGPVWSAGQTTWAWQDSLSGQAAFRDPFVMADPAHPGHWLMYFTASYAIDSTATVVGVAGSDGDLSAWYDLGPLLETWRAYTYNGVTESPHLFRHGDLWYLFVTTNAGQLLTFYMSTDPVGPLSAWTYRGRLRNLIGEDTSTWFASEALVDGTHTLFAYVQAERIEFREVRWNGDWEFSLAEPPLFHVLSAEWQRDTVRAGDTAQVVLNTANSFAGPPHLVAYLVDSLGAETPVAAESLGLASAPVLGSDSDTLRWVARRWPREYFYDTTTVMRFRLRTSDSTAASNVITVLPPARPDTVRVEDPTDFPPDPNDPPIRPVLRTVSRSPLGDGPAVVVVLQRSALARLDLFDVTGRRVRTLVAGELPGGASLLPWDGRDDAGVRQSRGVYFARLAASGCVRTARVLLIGN